jgi:glycosyltransferase involved in cell wall biosynthesis
MNRKKRILANSETSFLSTGFGTYGYEVLSRLQATGKYELAELATYGHVNDHRDSKVAWRYYANAVANSDPRSKEYHSNYINQFGAWRLERVCLDFKPDIVWSFRDPWMCMFENDSPFREFFNLTWMPTVDSAPQKPEWIDYFIQVDNILTYTDWCYKVLEKQGGGKINLVGTASPAINQNQFVPVKDIKQHRKNMGVEEDIFIVGTIMRNQKRKLFYELFDAFNKYLDKCYKDGKEDLAKKTFLYCHTSHPDIGWNFPQLLKETGLGHKVLFTYKCRCGNVFCSLFQDSKTMCPRCNQPTAVLPSVAEGLTRDQLVKVYQLFDGYVQYSITEGFGMPMVEAASCGVPVMAVDYSAMEDVVRNVNGFPLKVKHMFLESETQAFRAMPDNEFLAEQLYRFFTASDSYRDNKRKKARDGVEKTYSWDKTAKIWEHHFDSIELTGLQGKWDTPPRLRQILPMPTGLDNINFLHWIFTHLLQQPNRLKTYYAMNILRNLNNGTVREGNKTSAFINICEKCRCGMSPLIWDDYLEYANLKDSLRE